MIRIRTAQRPLPAGVRFASRVALRDGADVPADVDPSTRLRPVDQPALQPARPNGGDPTTRQTEAGWAR